MLLSLFYSLIMLLSPLDGVLEKRAYKTLYKYYGQEVLLSQNQRVLPDGIIYTIEGTNDKIYIGKGRSKFEAFDYMVILQDKTIKHIKILAYRENYGGEICSKKYLERNYNGRNTPKPFVDAISGATISVKALNYSVNNLIRSL